MRFNYCVLIFVVETDDITISDDYYIKKFLQIHYADLYSNTIKVDFIHMGGNGNYNSNKVNKEIKDKINLINDPSTLVKVIYCFDRDRINKDKEKIKEYQTTIKHKGGYFVLFSKNIEVCFNAKGHGNKFDTAKYFYIHAKKKDIPITIFSQTINKCKSINRGSN